jgi:hypothetical protein
MSWLRWVFILSVTLAAATLPAAAHVGATRMLRFEGTAAIAREDVDAGVSIDLLRWSTDEEMEGLGEALADGTEEVSSWLDEGETIGYVWTAESVGYAVRYAYRLPSDNGGQRIILALNEPFASRNPNMWRRGPEPDPAARGGGGRGGRGGGGGGGRGGGRGGDDGGDAAPEEPELGPFSILELRLDADGRGEARDILTSGLAYALGIDAFEIASPLLEDLASN